MRGLGLTTVADFYVYCPGINSGLAGMNSGGGEDE
jgi:hypothetical protein|tara:strand:+ start:122 stop:226 length:105 start_codon:yes stop_codon:yes gene_type:complete